MTGSAGRPRWIAAALGALLVIGAVIAGFVLKEQSGSVAARPPEKQPELLLLTSLPIVFPEEFTLEASQSPALAALQRRYKVVPISTTDEGALGGRRLLLMAQPQAQPAEMLVELDEWVRRGGHVLLLADPVLEWPTQLALGDPSRPPFAFPDTGLLGHWGLRLDAPERLGPETFEVGGRTVHALSPGSLVETGPECKVAADGLIARCRIGRGQATVVADADFLDVERRRGTARSGNLDFLLAELARLER